MIKRLVIVLLIGSLFSATRITAQEKENPKRLSNLQQYAWESDWGDDTWWQEHSERVNSLKFEAEGSYDDVESHYLNSREKSELKKLRNQMIKKHQEVNHQWKKRARKIKEKWGTVEKNTAKIFVDYTADNNAFGKINYEKGFLEVGAIAPATLINAPFRIERMLSERLSFLFSTESIPGTPSLKGQVLMPGTGKLVNRTNLREFSQKVAQTPKPRNIFLAPDGVRRIRKQVRVDFLPNHMETRMKQYVPLVERAARIYDVASALILAVIQTESSFNHRAVSNSGAVGLMQLVPSTGALEASKLVYGEPKMMSHDELYQPHKNIELGTAYLHILLKRYFEEYASDPEKRNFLAIASYNCGPRRVKQALGSHNNVDGLSAKELYQLLIKTVPPETRKYLEKVVERMRQYESNPWTLSPFSRLFACLY